MYKLLTSLSLLTNLEIVLTFDYYGGTLILTVNLAEPDVHEFSRVVFGKTSAPMEAQVVAQENARIEPEGTRMCIHRQLRLCSNPLDWKLCKTAFS